MHSFAVGGEGKLDGVVEVVLILNDEPYKTGRLSGSVDFHWGGDWYSDQAEIRSKPIFVTGGNLELKSKFNEL